MEAIVDTQQQETIENGNDSQASRSWKVCGTDMPRSELVFFSQVVIIYVVVCLCLYNLTTGRGDSNLWSALLSGFLGYLLPNPTIKQK